MHGWQGLYQKIETFGKSSMSKIEKIAFPLHMTLVLSLFDMICLKSLCLPSLIDTIVDDMEFFITYTVDESQTIAGIARYTMIDIKVTAEEQFFKEMIDTSSSSFVIVSKFAKDFMDGDQYFFVKKFGQEGSGYGSAVGRGMDQVDAFVCTEKLSSFEKRMSQETLPGGSDSINFESWLTMGSASHFFIDREIFVKTSRDERYAMTTSYESFAILLKHCFYSSFVRWIEIHD